MGDKFKILLILMVFSYSNFSQSKGKNDKKRRDYAQKQSLKEERELSDIQRSLLKGQSEELSEEYEDRERRNVFGGRFDFKVISDKLDNLLQNTSIKFGLGFFDYNLGGTSIGARYRYEDRPSYVGGSYTRADLWRLNIDTNFLNWFTEDALIEDFSFNPYFDFGINFFFARQHKDERPAGLLKLPLLPIDIPLTAKKAMENLKIDDFFALPSHVDLGSKNWLPKSHCRLINSWWEIFIIGLDVLT